MSDGLHGTSMWVAPLVGAWIEMIPSQKQSSRRSSLLSWERGLKYAKFVVADEHSTVAPLVGAWIEILAIAVEGEPDLVAPLVGAWIEITVIEPIVGFFKSLLSWERGLK